MKSHRKKQRRSAETVGSEKSLSAGEPDGKLAPQPPKRNIAMLSVSVCAFVVWTVFLAYVALFQ